MLKLGLAKGGDLGSPLFFLEAEMVYGTTEETKVREIKFRLTEQEGERLPKLIEYAFKAGYIKKESIQDFMVFALNCVFSRLKGEYEQRKGRQ